MLDLSGNNYHAYQTDDAFKPTYRTDGINHWLEFHESFLTTDYAHTAGIRSALFAVRPEGGAGTRRFITESYPSWYGLSASIESNDRYSVFFTSALSDKNIMKWDIREMKVVQTVRCGLPLIRQLQIYKDYAIIGGKGNFFLIKIKIL